MRNISGNERPIFHKTPGLKIFVSVFDVDNDGKKGICRAVWNGQVAEHGEITIVYYKDIGRKQVRVTARDLNFWVYR